MNEIHDPIARILGEWSMGINWGSILLRTLLAVVLGAVVGCERSSKRHAAGLRTFILVTFGAAVAMMLELYLDVTTQGNMYFLSAAAIIAIAIISQNSVLFSSRNQIKGLTTSAALWVCGIIGLTAGAGFYMVTLVAFAALMCSLSLFPAIENYLKDRSNHFEVHLELKSRSCLRDVMATIRVLGLRIDDIVVNPAYVNSGLSVYSVSLTIYSEELKKYKTHSQIIEALGTLEYVHHIEEMRG